ncbi:hypothetical protein ACHAXT_001497 [Thalassiosira profunda]
MSQQNGLNGNLATSRRQEEEQFANVPQSQAGPMQAMPSHANPTGPLQHQLPQSLLDEGGSSSLVYDRTIKVPKTGYADHGSHGVAALPLPGQGTVGEVAGGLPSSVQMQLQMQQMAAAMLQQQQRNNAAQPNNPQQQMMPPPPNGNGGGMAGGSGTSCDPSLAPVVNTTSSTGLMQALNAQIAANQAAVHRAAAANAATGEGGLAPLNVVDQNGNWVPNPSVFGSLGASNLDATGGVAGAGVAGTDGTMAPGDVRNGKKRVSPSVPLHPSQLQLHHSGAVAFPDAAPGMGGFVPVSNRIHAVAEEDESLCNANSGSFTGVQAQDPALPSIDGAHAQQGLLGSALNDSLPQQQQGLPQSPPKEKQQKGKAGAKQKSSGSADKDERHGEVLTNPSVPSSNSGLDNAEGNLIVRRGDVLKIPRKNVHAHPPTKDAQSKAKGKGRGSEEGHVEYKVISLLGQGTFAQVFYCVDQASRQCVAVKIVKNKPAYTRQAAVEIDVFRKLNAVDGSTEGGSSMATAAGDAGKACEGSTKGGASEATSTSYTSSYSSFDTATTTTATPSESVINLLSYFMHHSHLCLVFEMLGPNLYELLKKRQFRGLPIAAVRTLVRQATEGIKLLGKRNVVHCDLKPENILMVRGGDDGEGGSEDVEAVISECKAKGEVHTAGVTGDSRSNIAAALGTDRDEQHEQFIKLIDFGSACFEGQTTHTYIQSRFYRSPEVLVGLPYDSAIDIWSLGCVAAELFLGLPILPGVHEHDQLGRILEMIGQIPEWMLEKGSKSAKFFKSTPGSNPAKPLAHSFGPSAIYNDGSDPSPSSPTTWEFKSRQEYIAHLTSEEKRSKGGAAKLEQQQTNRYFKKRKLEDIVMHHGVCNTNKEREQLGLFVHFLKGVLDPDPWKRWTAHQASMHPFLTGSTVYRIKTMSGDGTAVDGKAKPYEIQWQPPWDASISKRKLLVIQKTQEKAAAAAKQQATANTSPVRRRSSLNESALRSTISQSVPETGVAVHPNNMMVPPLSTAQAPLLDIYGSPLKGATHMPNLQIQPSPSAMSVTSQMAAMADAMSLERARSNISMGGRASPPPVVAAGGNVGQYPAHPAMLSASVGGAAGVPLSPYHLNLAGRSLSDNLMHPAEQQLAVAVAQHQQLQALANANDAAAFLQPPPPLPPPPTFMGAQSFSGAYYQPGLPSGSHYPYVESDLGYALQRPGVFPAGMMGGDGGQAQFMSTPLTPLRRLSSNSIPGQAMLSSSLSNLSSSTPQNYGGAPGSMMNYQSTAVPASPGGLLLQKLGLHEQIMMQAAGASLLSQQLEEYSQADPQQQPMALVSGSAGMLNTGSYLGGPVSASLPQDMQSASFGDVGSSIQQQQLAQMQAQMQAQQLLQMNASFPPPEAGYGNTGVPQQQNTAAGQPNSTRRPTE